MEELDKLLDHFSIQLNDKYKVISKLIPSNPLSPFGCKLSVYFVDEKENYYHWIDLFHMARSACLDFTELLNKMLKQQKEYLLSENFSVTRIDLVIEGRILETQIRFLNDLHEAIFE